MASKLSLELDLAVRNRTQWQNLPIHLKQVFCCCFPSPMCLL